MPDVHELIDPLLRLHEIIADEVAGAAERDTRHALAQVSRQEADDTIYAIDLVAEETLGRFARWLSDTHTFVLIAEGLSGGMQVWPQGTSDADADWRIIVDPIDGTRGLMYQKRSGWILTAVAPNRGPATSLQDIVLAIQTEIPLRKQHLSDQLVAVKGEGVFAHRQDRALGGRRELHLHPSTAGTIEHGYATVVRFFPGNREELAAIDDEIVRGALGAGEPGKAACFEDQYASTGGQLYELAAGHDRFIADLRPLVSSSGLCAHPYDICTALIAQEMGVIITDPEGAPLDVPLDTTTNVAWVGYANAQIQRQIEPHLQSVLRRRGWI
jgi:fructose-1,6-bisphosphatase/inositol monophosphatase family enzyme